MTTQRAVEQRVVFDEVAALYERARPRYPAPFVDEVCRRAALGSSARIVEVGCGPAIATPPFAERGYAMVCIEPGARMAELARERLRTHPRVSVVTTTFEDWSGDLGAFDLLLAAQSFHWVDPAVAFPKAAQVLRPGGGIAILANLPQHGSSPARAALDEVYAKYGDAFAKHVFASGAAAKTPLHDHLAESPAFGPVERVEHAWSARYETPAYLELMQTQSDHRMLPPRTLDALLGEIGAALNAHGGAIEVEYVARLLFARRLAE